MKHTKQRILVLLLAALLLLLPTFALADGDASDTAGNLFTEGGSGLQTALDLLGTGYDLTVADSSIGASALMAGYNVRLTGSTVGGSVRAAGYTVILDGNTVAQNITAAGYSVQASGSAAGVIAAGRTVSFYGDAQSLFLFGETALLDGTVDGDAKIYADRVVIGENAVVTGTLSIQASAMPEIPASAAVGTPVFEQTETQETTAAVTAATKLVSSLRTLIMKVPGRILLAVLYFLLIGGMLAEAADMVKTRPVAMPVSGLIGLIAVPVAALIVCLTYIGIPAGGLIGALYALCLIFSVSFMGSVLGRIVFPKMHALLAAIIGVTVLTVLGIVPVLGTVIGIACSSYTLGYFLQKCFLKLKKAPAAPEAPAEAVPAAQADAALPSAEEPAVTGDSAE